MDNHTRQRKNTMRKFLILLPLLVACQVGNLDTHYEHVEEVIVTFCDTVSECGNAPGGTQCVEYNMTNICHDNVCDWSLSEAQQEQVDKCLVMLDALQCSAPLAFPAQCKEILLWGEQR